MQGKIARVEALQSEISRLRKRIAQLEKIQTIQDAVRKELARGESHYRALVETSPLAISRLTAACDIVFCNQRKAEMFGYASPSEVVGLNGFDLVAPQDRERALHEMEKLIATGSVHRLELVMQRKDGSTFPVEFSASRIDIGPEAPAQFVDFIEDVTDRKQAEQALAEKSAYLDNILSSSTDYAIATTDLDFRITYYNPMAVQLHGQPASEVLGRKLHDIHAARNITRKQLEAAVREVRKHGSYSFSFEQKGARGVRMIDSRISGIFDAAGELVGFANFSRDVTERRLAETKLKQSEESYRSVFENASDAIYILDSEGRFLDVNKGAVAMYGHSRQYFIGKTPDPLLAPDKNDIREVRSFIKNAFKGKPQRFEVWALRKNGEIFPKLVRLNKGAYFGQDVVIAFGLDMTQSKMAEEALRQSEERYRALYENVPSMYFTLDERANVISVNRFGAAQLGYSVDELVGHPILKIFYEEDRPEVERQLARCLADSSTTQSWQFRKVRKDGSIVWVEEYARTVPGPAGARHVLVVCHDITERRLAAEALHESKEKYRQLVELAQEGIWRIDKDGITTFVNPAMSRMLGYSESEMIGRHLFDFMDERGKELAREGLKRRQAGIAEVYDLEYIRKDGQRVYATLATTALSDREGNYAGALAGVVDVTGRIRQEEQRQKLEAQVQHAQKLESLGVLAGGIAHDFNNLLTGILGNVGLAQMDVAPGSPVDDCIAHIETAALRAAELCKQMLAYSGRGRFSIEVIDLNSVVSDMTHLLNVSISKKAKVSYNLARNLPPIEVDIAQIQQVLMNLILNASDALDDARGVINVSTGTMECNSEYLRTTYLDDELPAGTYVYVEVSDSGCGMDEETLGKVFDPFYSTKFAGRGLGLAAVLGIVRGHKGAVRIDSQVGRGTTFTVLFPATLKETTVKPEAPKPTQVWRGEGTILLADDEVAVRTLGRKVLGKTGFTVLTAEDGSEAVDLYREHHADLVLVILDLTMPNLDGEQAYREMRNINNAVPVILSSGYDQQETTARFEGKGLSGFIQKPYKAAALVDIVREVLEQSSGGPAGGE